ncbi:MAG: ABC transporter permease, partial [Clostridia bacterium]|nr:ABC transporter permease [Clostridia bacterium]MBQ9966714.1 ABC transporter permease [Clostridia bacterium]
TITFFLVHSIPGDPITAMVQDLPEETREIYLAKYGFDQPLTTQYIRFMKQLLTGDLGSSLRYPGRRVIDIVKNYAPISGTVGGTSLAIGFTLGIFFGIIAAFNRNKWPDKVVMLVAILGTTIPTFVTASVLQYALTVTWPLFPTTGWGDPKHIVLPVVCMTVGPIATYARYMRSSVLDVTNQDYILTAEAKGTSEFKIITRHVFRNSFLPCITMICTSIVNIFSGSFIVESIYAIPGMGKYFISAINDRDYSVVLGLNIIITGVYILSMLLCDILMAFIDPRIRFSSDN